MMVIRFLDCYTPYYNYFYSSTSSDFDYFTPVTYIGSGYFSESISFNNWGFKMYDFSNFSPSTYYGRVKFQMTASCDFAIVILDTAYNYQSVVYSDDYFQFEYTYDIITYRLSNVRFVVVNLGNVSMDTTLSIYQLT